MPITRKGMEVLRNLIAQYGEKKARRIFYAMIVKGKKGSSKWHGKGSGKLEKAHRTYLAKRKRAYRKAFAA